MRSRAGLAVAVTALLVLAGCGTFVGGTSGPESTETVTPVAVTTPAPATPTPSADPPPGVSANGSVDIERLVDAHESYVANRSYTWRFRYTIARWNGTLEQNITRQATVGKERFLVEQTNAELARSQSLYVGDVGYLRASYYGETKVERVSRPQDHRSYAFAGDVVARFLTGVSVDVSVVERDGRTYYRLYTDGNDVPRPLNRFSSEAWNYTVTAYVTPQGFVRTVAVDYNRQGRDGNRRITSRYDYSAVGSTTVTEPDWVSRATPTPERTAGTATETPTTGPAGTATETPTASPGENATATPAARVAPAVEESSLPGRTWRTPLRLQPGGPA